MAVYRQTQKGDVDPNLGWKGFLFCCLGNKKDKDKDDDTEKQQLNGKDVNYGAAVESEEPKVDDKKTGSAYHIEDGETSSDSEDEGQKLYKDAMTRSVSVRGSTRSKKSSSQHNDEERDLINNAERGMTAENVQKEKDAQDQKDFENQGYQGDPQDNVYSNEEHLFDVSDLQNDSNIISKCGQLDVSFLYENDKGKMNVTVIQAKDIPAKDRGGANSTQVRLLILPTKKQRFKTKIKNGENPEFQETFQFKVPQDEVTNMGVRLRLYGCERMRRERMIGESVIGFASLNLETETQHTLTLEPRSNISPFIMIPINLHVEGLEVESEPDDKPNKLLNWAGDDKTDVASLSRSDSASSTQSMQHGGMPELLLGLSYNGTTGRLSTEVIKGSNFRNMAMNRAPDTYVKLTLMSANGQELARSKTSIRRGQPNPLFKETFMFQVALFQLPDVTLMVSVYNKRSMKRKEMIGWFSTGLNSSGEEELSHWKDMVDSKGEQVCRWHVLLEA